MQADKSKNSTMIMCKIVVLVRDSEGRWQETGTTAVASRSKLLE